MKIKIDHDSHIIVNTVGGGKRQKEYAIPKDKFYRMCVSSDHIFYDICEGSVYYGSFDAYEVITERVDDIRVNMFIEVNDWYIDTYIIPKIKIGSEVFVSVNMSNVVKRMTIVDLYERYEKPTIEESKKYWGLEEEIPSIRYKRAVLKDSDGYYTIVPINENHIKNNILTLNGSTLEFPQGLY